MLGPAGGPGKFVPVPKTPGCKGVAGFPVAVAGGILAR